MPRFSKNPFAGIQGKEQYKTSLPFKLDKECNKPTVNDELEPIPDLAGKSPL